MIESEKILIEKTIAEQDRLFKTGVTLDVGFRLKALKNLKLAIKKRENDIIRSLEHDLHKSPFESMASEIGLVYQEINYHLRKLRKWASPRRVPSTLFAFPSKSYIYQQPYGRVLIISPFNYPFQLNIVPLIGAISAGNTAVLKPSEFTSETALMIEKIISETFGQNYIKVFTGGAEVSKLLLEQKWNKIFFTGSQRVGKIVLESAAKYLTPVVLELGGKNPAIVDKNADLRLSAKRIAWGKWLNSGQSCISPDYVLIHADVKNEFLNHIRIFAEKFFGQDPSASISFSRMINPASVLRQSKFLAEGKVVFGGNFNPEENYFSPTVITDLSPESQIMQEEVFGPVLPVLTFNHLDEALELINRKEPPLSVYFFSSDRKKQKEVLLKTYSGGASINDVVIYFVNPELPFGGVGGSGMGSYHGKSSFNAFSHERSVLKTSTLIDFPARYPPYKNFWLKFIRYFFRQISRLI
jgi:aldehyde dehydrogenase (NAD+)